MYHTIKIPNAGYVIFKKDNLILQKHLKMKKIIFLVFTFLMVTTIFAQPNKKKTVIRTK